MFSFAESFVVVIHFSQVVVGSAPFSQNRATPIGDRVSAEFAMFCVVVFADKREVEKVNYRTVFYFSKGRKALWVFSPQ